MENQTEQPKKKIYTRWWFWVLVVIILLILNGMFSHDSISTQQSFSSSTNTTANTQSTSTPKTPLTSFGDGTYIVGTDIEAGTYHTSGGQFCSYERLSGFGGTDADIIAIENPNGSAIVTIAPTDKGFLSANCGTWTLMQTSASKTTKTASVQQPSITQPTPTSVQTQSIKCSTNSQCGTNYSTGSPACQGNAVYQNYVTYTCNNPGTPQSYCSNDTTPQLQQTCNTSQTCGNGTCNTPATWHTVQTFNGSDNLNTPSFSMQGGQWRITYSCNVADNSDSTSWFDGKIEPVSGYALYNDTFAQEVNCPTSNTSYIYSVNPGQYYLEMTPWNSSYTVTVEDYY